MFFRRKDKLLSENFTYEGIASLLSLAFLNEYNSGIQILNEIEGEGDSIGVEKFRQTHNNSFEAIREFLVGEVPNSKKLPILEGERRIDLNYVKNIFETAPIDRDLRIGLVANELAETCIYFVHCVQTGMLISMPNATLSNSKNYRAYLLGNNLNSYLNWGWDNTQKNALQEADVKFTMIMGELVTSNYDMLMTTVRNQNLITAIHKKVCTFVASLSILWEFSVPRAKLGLQK